jgi:hypothetical protein
MREAAICVAPVERELAALGCEESGDALDARRLKDVGKVALHSIEHGALQPKDLGCRLHRRTLTCPSLVLEASAKIFCHSFFISVFFFFDNIIG